MRPEIRDAANKELFDEWLDAIAERTGTDPQRDMYPRLVAAVVRAVGDAATEIYVRAEPPVADHHADPCRLRRGRGGHARTRQRQKG